MVSCFSLLFFLPMFPGRSSLFSTTNLSTLSLLLVRVFPSGRLTVSPFAPHLSRSLGIQLPNCHLASILPALKTRSSVVVQSPWVFTFTGTRAARGWSRVAGDSKTNPTSGFRPWNLGELYSRPARKALAFPIGVPLDDRAGGGYSISARVSTDIFGEFLRLLFSKQLPRTLRRSLWSCCW